MKRNLLYYVRPRQCSMLAYNLYLLHTYHEVFNGRKIVFAAEDEPGYAIDGIHLDWMLNDTHSIGPYELHVVPHGPRSMERCLARMLDMVESDDPEEISFFAHAKDTSTRALERADVGELSAWVEPIYRMNLGSPALIDGALSGHPCAGTFMERDAYTKTWLYYGSFFWVNHREIFKRNWKTALDNTATFLSRLFPCQRAFNFGGDEYIDVRQTPDKSRRFTEIVRNWDPSRVTIVTTSMNRWEFLQRSLRTWLGRGFARIVVVDWSSDDPVAGFLSSRDDGRDRVTVMRVDGERIFNGGMARNTGARLVESEYILFIDSDMTLEDWSVTSGISMVPGRFYHGPHNIPPFGTSLVRAGDFRAVNGYSELYPAYGWEDNDFYNRLEESGLRRCIYDDRLASHIDHDDDLRAKHRDQRGRMLHETVWANREIEKWTTSHARAVLEYTVQDFRM